MVRSQSENEVEDEVLIHESASRQNFLAQKKNIFFPLVLSL